MVEEYDPNSFSVRVSQGLFESLAGRAAEPGPIEPRTPREASLIEAVRHEGRREQTRMLKSLKQQQVKEAYEREQKAELALVESGEKLQEKLRSFGYPSNVSGRAPEPCENFRNAIATCYRVNGKDNPLACAGEVEAFTECAKQLSKVSS